MPIPEFLSCPRCHTGSFRESIAGLSCDGCGQSFPTLFGIFDFRNAELDKTAAFSIAEDRRLAERLSIAFSETTTFNELHDVYKILSAQTKHGADRANIDIEYLRANGTARPRHLSNDQLAHGKAILEKLPHYIRETTHAMPPNDIALEDGCGLGLFIDGFSAHFKKLVVLDFSLCHLLLAKKIAEERNLNNVMLVCGNAECLPLRTGTFDFVHSNNVIEHVSNQRALFTEAKRVLKSNGLLFVMSPNRFSSYLEPHFRLPFYGFIPKPIRRRIIHMRQHRSIDEISLLSLSELRALAAEQFGENITVSFIPRHLNKTETGGFIRHILVRSLNSRILGAATNLLVNRILLGLMPYHVALCSKRSAIKDMRAYL